MPILSNLSAPAPYVRVGLMSQLTSLSTHKTIQIAEGATGVLIQTLSQNVRFTIDGVTIPTATVGFQLMTGILPVYFSFPPGTILRFIEEAASATIQYQQVGVLTTLG